MNAELKAKWVAALRSGKYEQGRGKLRDTYNRYCCLGVACDISGLGHWVKRYESEQDDTNMYRYTTENGGMLYDLAADLRVFFGISEEYTERLIRMNDRGEDRPKTFAEIADWIEQNL